MASLINLSRNANGITVVGGQAMETNSSAAEVAGIQNTMVNRGILPQSSSPPGDASAASLDILSALNVSIDHSMSREFSLLSTETDTEVIENPNIIDTVKWEETVNENILTTTSFPAAADNFFKVQEGLAESEKRAREKVEKEKEKKNLIGFTSKLINYNLADPTRGTLPQFKLEQ
jgi:hypothetical protein